jgi:signal transduction histidine kinase
MGSNEMSDQGGAVSVAAKHDVQIQPARLVVQVNDTGLGTPPDIQSRLFQKFVSGGQVEHGSGLGLAFCRLAVEAHGERIWVDSVPGRGATFTFTLATGPSTP